MVLIIIISLVLSIMRNTTIGLVPPSMDIPYHSTTGGSFNNCPGNSSLNNFTAAATQGLASLHLLTTCYEVCTARVNDWPISKTPFWKSASSNHILYQLILWWEVACGRLIEESSWDGTHVRKWRKQVWAEKEAELQWSFSWDLTDFCGDSGV